MADYRSKSYNHGKMQIEPYHTTRPVNFRSYSTSYTSSRSYAAPPPHKLKKGRSTSRSWSFNDPEFQRRRRVASYKVYSAEGKLKGSVRKSVKWIKDRYTHIVDGWL